MGILGKLFERLNEPSLEETLAELRQLEEADFAEEARTSIHDTKLRVFGETLATAAELTVDRCRLAVSLYNIKTEGSLDKLYDFVKKTYHDCFEIHKQIVDSPEMETEYQKGIIRLKTQLRLCVNYLANAENAYINGEKVNRMYNFKVLMGPLCLLAALSDDPALYETVKSLHVYHTKNTYLFSFLHEEEYGKFSLPEVEHLSISKVEDRIFQVKEMLKGDINGNFENLREALTEDFLYVLGARIWYYAAQKNVDQEEMLDAEQEFSEFRWALGMHLECILAEVYVKNKLGGENFVMQNLDEIMAITVFQNPIFARTLSSFLAWMECYHVELEVLKKTVQAKIELDPDMQERLDFLAKGGADNTAHIYDVPSDSENFYFDISTEQAKGKDLDLLFEVLRKKQRTLDYALSLNRWTKTLPLQRGQKFADEQMDAAMQKLVQDFDGEVTLERVNAVAINIDNVRHDNCMLFRLLNERSRGLGILFHYEKFGRNLNLYFITLFIADDEMGDSAVNFAKAIASNQYVESFQESVLAALDEVLRIKQDIY